MHLYKSVTRASSSAGTLRHVPFSGVPRVCQIHAVPPARPFASSAGVHGFFSRKAKVAPPLPVKEGFFAKAERRGKLFLDVVNGVDRVHDSMERILGMTVWFVIAWVIYKNADSLGLKEFYEESKASLQTTFEDATTRFTTMQASLSEGISNAKLRVDGAVASVTGAVAAGKQAASKAADLAGGAANAASTALVAARKVSTGSDTPAGLPADGAAADGVLAPMLARAPMEAVSDVAPTPAALAAMTEAVATGTPDVELEAALAAIFAVSPASIEPGAVNAAVVDSQHRQMPATPATSTPADDAV